MELRITNVRAQIGINKTDAVLSIQQPPAELDMSTTPIELNIKNDFPRVKIDQSQCFSEAGLKDVLELTDEYAQMGKEAVQEYIAKTAADGDRMAMIQEKSDAFAELDAGELFQPPADFNIDYIPKSRPKIDFEGGVSMNPQPGKLQIKANAHTKAEINATYPQISFYLAQKPEFHFEFVGNNIDISR